MENFSFYLNDIENICDVGRIHTEILYTKASNGCFLVTGNLDNLFFVAHDSEPTMAEHFLTKFGCNFYAAPSAYNYDDINEKLEKVIAVPMLRYELNDYNLDGVIREIEEERQSLDDKEEKPKSFFKKLLTSLSIR